MTEAEEVIEALTDFKCGDKVWNVNLPSSHYSSTYATILRPYDPSTHLVEVYANGCYQQQLWYTCSINHVDF